MWLSVTKSIVPKQDYKSVSGNLLSCFFSDQMEEITEVFCAVFNRSKRRCRCNYINIFEEDMGDRRILGKRWIK